MSPLYTIPRRPRPLRCTWEVTLACTCHCIHCGSTAGSARRGELSTAEALDLIEQLAALGCRGITLSGGEPLLRADWPALVAAMHERGIRPELITNGLAVAEQVDKIAEARFFGVSMSIDGPAAIHDRLRGQAGLHERSLHGAAELIRRGIRTGAVTQINRLNRDCLTEVHDLLVQRGFDGWQVQLTVPHGRAAEADSLCLAPRDLPSLEQAIVGLVRRGQIFVQAADTIGWMSPCEPLLRAGSPRGDRVWGTCQAGLRAVGITSDGTVRGCLSMPAHFDEGNIRQRSLADIWLDPEGFSYNRRFDPAALHGVCGECDFGRICRAGCTCLAWLATGDTLNNPYCLLAEDSVS